MPWCVFSMSWYEWSDMCWWRCRPTCCTVCSMLCSYNSAVIALWLLTTTCASKQVCTQVTTHTQEAYLFPTTHTNSVWQMQINSCDLLHFSISAHNRVPDCRRFTPWCPHSVLQRVLEGAFLGTAWHSRVNSEQYSWEIAWDDGINNCDLLLCYSAMKRAEMAVTGLWSPWEQPAARGAPSQLSQRSNGTGKQLEVLEHTVFTIGKHTPTQSRHAQYDILFAYRAASVSWSSQRLMYSIEPCGRNTAWASIHKCSSSPSESLRSTHLLTPVTVNT